MRTLAKCFILLAAICFMDIRSETISPDAEPWEKQAVDKLRTNLAEHSGALKQGFPTPEPTFFPTRYPTGFPFPGMPTFSPSPPTPFPTEEPTPKPSHRPSFRPTEAPSPRPTNSPVTSTPSSSPTHFPSQSPEFSDTSETTEPTEESGNGGVGAIPTPFPTRFPTPETAFPTLFPTKYPVINPTTEAAPSPPSENTPGFTQPLETGSDDTIVALLIAAVVLLFIVLLVIVVINIPERERTKKTYTIHRSYPPDSVIRTSISTAQPEGRLPDEDDYKQGPLKRESKYSTHTKQSNLSQEEESIAKLRRIHTAMTNSSRKKRNTGNRLSSSLDFRRSLPSNRPNQGKKSTMRVSDIYSFVGQMDSRKENGEPAAIPRRKTRKKKARRQHSKHELTEESDFSLSHIANFSDVSDPSILSKIAFRKPKKYDRATLRYSRPLTPKIQKLGATRKGATRERPSVLESSFISQTSRSKQGPPLPRRRRTNLKSTLISSDSFSSLDESVESDGL